MQTLIHGGIALRPPQQHYRYLAAFKSPPIPTPPPRPRPSADSAFPDSMLGQLLEVLEVLEALLGPAALRGLRRKFDSPRLPTSYNASTRLLAGRLTARVLSRVTYIRCA